MPSGPMSARMRADNGRSGSYCPHQPHRQHHFAWRAPSASRCRRCGGRGAPGVIAARSSQGVSALSELSVSAMPPAFGRVRLRLMSWNVHCLPLRWSSTVRLPLLRPISLKFVAVETGGAEAVEPGQQRGEIRDHRAGRRPATWRGAAVAAVVTGSCDSRQRRCRPAGPAISDAPKRSRRGACWRRRTP